MIKELKNITNTIVEGVEPVAIYLFGSAKNFDLKPDSDLDICVLVRQTEGLRKISQKLYRLLIDSPYPIDIIVENIDVFYRKKMFNNLINKDISKSVCLYESK
jgi:predicted nucleotidyltransferase